MPIRAVFRRGTRNSQVDWGALDADAYVAENYRSVRDDDRQILDRAVEFFTDAATRSTGDGNIGWRAVDVGTGANLYPTLTMLPFAASVDLLEYSPTSVNWLEDQRARGFDANWEAFVQASRRGVLHERYYARHDARTEFTAKTRVQRTSIFTLPRRRWDAGTMFFTACSLSGSHDEFRTALARFIHALKPGAPFVAAFMTGSGGYRVRDRWFPAVRLEELDIKAALEELANEVDVRQIRSEQPLRPDVGMALATGFAIDS